MGSYQDDELSRNRLVNCWSRLERLGVPRVDLYGWHLVVLNYFLHSPLDWVLISIYMGRIFRMGLLSYTLLKVLFWRKI